MFPVEPAFFIRLYFISLNFNLNSDKVLIKWKEHLSGKMNWQYHLWDVLMFQAWLEKNKN